MVVRKLCGSISMGAAVGLVGFAAISCSGDDNQTPTPIDGGNDGSAFGLDATTDADSAARDAGSGFDVNSADSGVPDALFSSDVGADSTVVSTFDASADATADSAINGGAVDSSVDAMKLPDAMLASDVGPDTTAADVGTDSGPVAHFVYVQTNNPTPGQNGIFAFLRMGDGSLAQIAGSPFATGGTGVANPNQALGPDDSDQQMVASADKTLMFSVNSGSNTIAVLNIHNDGSLSAVTGSPFPSGGINPVSVGLAGTRLYVANQDGDPSQDAAAGSPNYTGFNVSSGGALSAIPNSTVAAGASPSMVLVSPDQKFIFGADFLAPLAPTPQPPLRSFVIQSDGTLVPAPGTPEAIPFVDGGMPPGTPAALGLAVHPSQNVLYVGFPMRNQIGVYVYDRTTGALTYQTEVDVSGQAPCWIRMSADGTRAYVTNTADDSVSVLDTTNPLAPSEIQHLVLKDPGPSYVNAADATVPNSQSYEEAISPDGAYLYVVSQRTTTDSTVMDGNVLHILTIGPLGKVAETVPDVALPVPLGARPQGVLAP